MGLIISLLVLPVIYAVLALIGAFFGVLLTYVPVVNEVLTVGTIAAPTAFAYVMIIGFTVAMFTNTDRKKY